MKLEESPVFQRMKAEGRHSKAPIKDSFGNWANARIVLIALFGAVAGQAVIWYAGQFYALFFLTQTLKVDAAVANYLMAGALLLGTPFFIVFGALLLAAVAALGGGVIRDLIINRHPILVVEKPIYPLLVIGTVLGAWLAGLAWQRLGATAVLKESVDWLRRRRSDRRRWPRVTDAERPRPPPPVRSGLLRRYRESDPRTRGVGGRAVTAGARTRARRALSGQSSSARMRFAASTPD
jgi:hypothetical protein